MLTTSGGAAWDEFGYAVAVSGDTAFVGAPRRTVNGEAEAGAVYVFTRAGSAWDADPGPVRRGCQVRRSLRLEHRRLGRHHAGRCAVQKRGRRGVRLHQRGRRVEARGRCSPPRAPTTSSASRSPFLATPPSSARRLRTAPICTSDRGPTGRARRWRHPRRGRLRSGSRPVERHRHRRSSVRHVEQRQRRHGLRLHPERGRMAAAGHLVGQRRRLRWVRQLRGSLG